MSAASELSEAGLLISGMNCKKCVDRVDQALRAVPGVQHAQVSLEGNNAVVNYDAKQTNPQSLADAVTKAGYPTKPSEKK
jgi:copper chaperone CopZ